MPGDFGKILNFDEAITYARGLQEAYCCYGTKEGDRRGCDCKYFVGWDDPKLAREKRRRGSEQTGCAEARALIEFLVMQKQEHDALEREREGR